MDAATVLFLVSSFRVQGPLAAPLSRFLLGLDWFAVMFC